MGYPIVALRRAISRALAPLGLTLRRATHPRGVRLSLLTVLLLILLAFPAVMDPVQVDAASRAEVLVLLALGLNIVVGFAGLLDLGYAAFYAIGAYVMAFFASSHFSITGHSFSSPFVSWGANGIHVNFFLMIPLSALAAAMCGVAFGAPTLRLRGDYLAIVTLGFGEIVPKLINNLGPDNSLGLPNITNGINRITGIDSPPTIQFLGINANFASLDPRPWYYLGLIIVIFSVAVIFSLRNSRLGRAWAAIREDEIAAAHMGINITRTRLLAFGLGAAFSGFGGLIEASRIGSVDSTDFLFDQSITILIMVILGGIGSIPGVILGAIIVSYLDLEWLAMINTGLHNLGSSLHTGFGPIGVFGAWLYGLNLGSARPLILGILMLGFMLLRPQGLWPSTTRSLELQPETEYILEQEDEVLSAADR